MAKRARTRAVEGLRDRLAERRALRIIYDHRCPRDGLERNPMQPDRATERENHGNAAGAAKHDCDANWQLVNVNARSFEQGPPHSELAALLAGQSSSDTL